jgi:uncharacterized damage-inducible protein DinB
MGALTRKPDVALLRWRRMIGPLEDAFNHHVWASLRVLEACATLQPEQRQTSVPGTYGTILDTLRHLVGSDRWYLFVMTGGAVPQIDEDHMALDGLRSAMTENQEHWTALLAEDRAPDLDIVQRLDDGSEFHAPMGIRLAQVVHHGTDHRSQICTALTTLGIEPPQIDVWDYGEAVGRTNEVPPSA